ncbi:MAG: hypothetical protein OXC48_11945 [Endozoicomonadaceae bacterium]|nr:hypothetical protein [Endozoicomonadaceae bacterium]
MKPRIKGHNKNSDILHPGYFRYVVAETTVQLKTITFSQDARLMYKAMISLGKLAREHGLKLRQSYACKAKEALVSYVRYLHAKQFCRAKHAKHYIKHRLGCIIWDNTSLSCLKIIWIYSYLK